MWIDSHCHLDHKHLRNQADLDVIINRARQAGVEGMLSINCKIFSEFDSLVKLIKPFPDVWCTVGTHPHDAGVKEEIAQNVGDIVRRASSDSKVIGIGESGLDYFYPNSSPEDQQISYRKHIQACLEANMPIVIHARDADEDILKIMKEEAGDNNHRGLRGVMHCFSSSRWLAEEALAFGFYLSFSGILTFKKSEELRNIARDTPKERLLVETDSPYLTPEPYRKEVNEPQYVTHTGECLAALHEVAPKDMAELTKQNFYTLFDRAA